MARSLTEFPTNCPVCIRAEMTKWDRAKEFASALLPISSTAIISSAFRGWTFVGKSWYERHRENFEKGGKEIELKRMLRHVK